MVTGWGTAFVLRSGGTAVRGLRRCCSLFLCIGRHQTLAYPTGLDSGGGHPPVPARRGTQLGHLLALALCPKLVPFFAVSLSARRPQPAGLHSFHPGGHRPALLHPFIASDPHKVCARSQLWGQPISCPGTSSGHSHAQVPAGGTGRRRWSAQTMVVTDPGAPEARRGMPVGSAAGAACTCTCTCWPRRATRCDLGVPNRRHNTASCPAGPAAFGAAGCRAPLALCRWGCVGAPASAWPGARMSLGCTCSTHQPPPPGPRHHGRHFQPQLVPPPAAAC